MLGGATESFRLLQEGGEQKTEKKSKWAHQKFNTVPQGGGSPSGVASIFAKCKLTGSIHLINGTAARGSGLTKPAAKGVLGVGP